MIDLYTLIELFGYFLFMVVFWRTIKREPVQALSLVLPLLLYMILIEVMGVAAAKYQYIQAARVWIGGVPLAVPLASCAIIASLMSLSERIFECFEKKNFLGLALLDAVLMVAVDLVIDPLGVAFGLWRYRGGGIYFGVPLWNYAGWFLAVFLFSIIYRGMQKFKTSQRISLIFLWVVLLMLARSVVYQLKEVF